MVVNEFYWFKNNISPDSCKKLIAISEGKLEPAFVNTKAHISNEERRSGVKDEFAPNNEVRMSDVFFSDKPWIYDLLAPYMQEANENAGWGYNITGCESVQISRYQGDEYYHWHRDGNACHISKYDEPENCFKHGNVRKLSMTVNLNDDYEGGNLEFATLNSSRSKYEVTEYTAPNNGVGSVLVFPSYVMHRITPVTKGTRYSLVAWFLGPPLT